MGAPMAGTVLSSRDAEDTGEGPGRPACSARCHRTGALRSLLGYQVDCGGSQCLCSGRPISLHRGLNHKPPDAGHILRLLRSVAGRNRLFVKS